MLPLYFSSPFHPKDQRGKRVAELSLNILSFYPLHIVAPGTGRKSQKIHTEQTICFFTFFLTFSLQERILKKFEEIVLFLQGVCSVFTRKILFELKCSMLNIVNANF